MKRLLWVTNIPTPYRLGLWSELHQQIDLTVITMTATEHNRDWDADLLLRLSEAQNLQAPHARLGSATLYWPTRELKKAARTPGRVVMIDGWESPAYLAAMRAAHACDNAVIVGYRGTAATQHHKRGPVAHLRSVIMNKADAVLTGGPPSTRAVLAMGVPEERVIEGVNAVDVQHLARLAPRLRRPHAGHAFLIVAQLVERKNIAAAIDAFIGIAGPDDRLAIVGSGPLKDSLAAKAKQDPSKHIEMLGALDGVDLIEAYANADTVVLPSIEEVYGLVVPEGLACGAHAVVSDRCGVAETVKHMAGVYMSSPTVDGLADAMRASRADFTGPIAGPEVLRLSLEASARRVLDAVAVASSNRTDSGHRPCN